MKKLLIIFLILYAQYSFTQTSLEEWKYMTKGYAIQKENGLGTKVGYKESLVYTNDTFVEGKKVIFNFIELYRLSDKSVCGIIVEFIKNDNNQEIIKYYGIPSPNTIEEIWEQSRESFRTINNKEIYESFFYALTQYVSYVSTKNFRSTFTQKEDILLKEDVNRINNLNKSGNPAGSSTSGENSWSVSGRSLSGRLVAPSYDKDTEGVITVQIRVDAGGNVTSATIGTPTTISDATMRNAAIAAARSTKFSAGSGTAAGSITYNFRLR